MYSVTALSPGYMLWTWPSSAPVNALSVLCQYIYPRRPSFFSCGDTHSCDLSTWEAEAGR